MKLEDLTKLALFRGDILVQELLKFTPSNELYREAKKLKNSVTLLQKISEFRRAFTLNPIKFRLLKANRLFNSGNYTQAIEDYRFAIIAAIIAAKKHSSSSRGGFYVRDLIEISKASIGSSNTGVVTSKTSEVRNQSYSDLSALLSLGGDEGGELEELDLCKQDEINKALLKEHLQELDEVRKEYEKKLEGLIDLQYKVEAGKGVRILETEITPKHKELENLKLLEQELVKKQRQLEEEQQKREGSKRTRLSSSESDSSLRKSSVTISDKVKYCNFDSTGEPSKHVQPDSSTTPPGESSQLHESIAALKKELEEKNTEIAGLKSKSSQTQETYTESLSSKDTEIKELQKKVKSLNGENTKAGEELKEVKENAGKRNDALAKLEKENFSLTSEKEKLEKNISDLNNQLEEKGELLNTKENELVEKQRQLVEEQQKEEGLKRTDNLPGKSSTAILYNKASSKESEPEEPDFEALDVSDKHMQFGSSSLSSAYAEDSSQLHRDTIVELQEELDAKDTKIANLKSKLIEEQEACTKKEEKIAIQGQKILTQEKEKLELQENLEELKENFKEVKEGYNQKEERILELDESNEILDKELKEQEELKDNFQKQLNEANKELKEAKRNEVERNNVLAKLEEENLRLTSEKNESVKNADHFTNLSQEKNREIEYLENQLRKQAEKERQSSSIKENELEEKKESLSIKENELMQKENELIEKGNELEEKVNCFTNLTQAKEQEMKYLENQLREQAAKEMELVKEERELFKEKRKLQTEQQEINQEKVGSMSSYYNSSPLLEESSITIPEGAECYRIATTTDSVSSNSRSECVRHGFSGVSHLLSGRNTNEGYSQLGVLQEYIEELEEKLYKKDINITNLEGQLIQTQEDFTKRLSKKGTQESDTTANQTKEIEKLKRKIELLKKTNVEKDEEVSKARELYNTLSTELEEHKEAIKSEFQKELDNVNEELRKMKENVGNQDSTLEEYGEEYHDNLMLRNKELDRSVSLLTVQLKEREQEIKDLQEELDGLMPKRVSKLRSNFSHTNSF